MDVFELFASLKLKKEEFDDGLDEAKDGAQEASSSIGSSLGSMVKGVTGAVTAAVAAAGAAIAGVAKEALSSYAEYEQLAGGVKKLFGDASDTVIENARNAWKTAGMSANEYMETTTSFTAALVQSLGGDTAKAADIADVAMRAMSDNVNTFGTDIESIKVSYAGFAKQNYTMLDNLKLGRTVPHCSV